MISILLNFLWYNYGPEHCLSLAIFHISLRRIYILLFFDGLFYKCQLWTHLEIESAIKFNYILTDFLPAHLLITERRMLKSPIVIVDFSIFPWSSSRHFLMYFDALLLGLSAFRTIRFSLCYCLYVNVSLYPWLFSLFWGWLSLKLI